MPLPSLNRMKLSEMRSPSDGLFKTHFWMMVAPFGIALVASSAFNGATLGILASLASTALVILTFLLDPQSKKSIGYFAPIAIVGLHAKLLGRCVECSGNYELIATNLAPVVGICGIAFLALFRTSSVIRRLVGTSLLWGQAGLLILHPTVCVACLICTYVVAGLTNNNNLVQLAPQGILRHVTQCTAVLGIISTVASSFGAYSLKSSGTVSSLAVETSARGAFAEEEFLIFATSDCPACLAANSWVKQERPQWKVLLPCSSGVEPCWNAESVQLPVPTLLKRDGKRFAVIQRGFQPLIWSKYP